MLRIRRLTHELEGVNVQLEDLNRQLQAFASVDVLTQLMNRRVLTERLDQEFARATRHRHPLACLMIDVDHFKLINDTHGHPVGDRVLVQVAAAISATIRKTDVAGRYGGEEFLVVIPETAGIGAQVLAERIPARRRDARTRQRLASRHRIHRHRDDRARRPLGARPLAARRRGALRSEERRPRSGRPREVNRPLACNVRVA